MDDSFSPPKRERTAKNPDTLPYSQDPVGPCPNCGRVANFNVQTNQGPGAEIAHQYRFVVLTCHGCGTGTLVIERRSPGKSPEPVFWWPTPGSGNLDPDVPAEVARAYDDGVKCLSAGVPRASVAMFRLMLGYIFDEMIPEADRGGRSRTVGQQLKLLRDNGNMHEALDEWADSIVGFGNAGAHSNAENLVEPTEAQAQQVQQLCRHLLTSLYEMPAKVRRSRGQWNTLAD